MMLVSLGILGCAPQPEELRAPDDVVDAGQPVTDASASADATLAEPCAVPAVERWSGTASRDNDDGYPDHITATITWIRTGTEGCVDTYVPSGSAHYGYAIPGALCEQSIMPADHPVAAADGTMTIDRSTSPATYQGSGATYWEITFHCVYQDGSFDDSQMDGGAAWFDAAGTVAAGAIAGSEAVDEDGDPEASQRCGPNGIAPCTYGWSFTAN